MSAHGTCWRCMWFDRDEKDEEGEGYCRRFPPSVACAEEDGVTVVEVWPSVEYLDWCGEFEEAEG